MKKLETNIMPTIRPTQIKIRSSSIHADSC